MQSSLITSGKIIAGLKISPAAGYYFFDNCPELLQYSGKRIRLKDPYNTYLDTILGAVGIAEVLGEELLTNPSVDVDTTGWYANIASGSATIASVAGGQSGNCLEITRVSGTHQQAGQTNVNFCNKLLKMSGYVKSGTSGDEAFRIYYGESGAWHYSPSLGITSASWAPFSYYLSNPSTVYNRYLGFEKPTATPGTMLYDELSIKQVLAPSPAGIYCITPYDASKIYLHAASYTYEIYDNEKKVFDEYWPRGITVGGPLVGQGLLVRS